MSSSKIKEVLDKMATNAKLIEYLEIPVRSAGMIWVDDLADMINDPDKREQLISKLKLMAFL